MAIIIATVVTSRKEGQDATVSGREGSLSSQGCGALAVTAAAGNPPGVALWARQIHRLEPEYDLPADTPQRAVHAHSRRHDRAAVRRAARNAERAVRVREAVVLGVVHHIRADVSACRAMQFARAPAADRTRRDLVGPEQPRRLLGTASAVPGAHQASRPVDPAQVERAVHLAIHRAHRLMGRAYRLTTARTRRDLVHAHRLVGSALAVSEARPAQPAPPLGARGVARLRLPLADLPAAAAARREARRARRVAVLRTHAGVSGAVLEPARRAHLHVLVARRLAVHPALSRPMVRTEVLAAHRAAVRAGLAAAVVVPADHQRGGRAATVRARERPARYAAERPLRGERGAPPPPE